MEQSIGQDEQANKFSAELRIRKTQVFVTSHLWHVFLFVNYLEGFLTSCSSLLIIIVISSLLTRLQTWRALIFSRVCLSVCLSVFLWLALLPFNIDRFRWNLVTRTLLWSSLAATIMVHIGRRGTVRRLFENFKIFWKITIRISKFWSIIFCVCVSCVL